MLELNRVRKAFFVLCLSAVFIGIVDIAKVWTLDQNGVSRISLKLPEWDYANMWFGGKLALSGHASTIFDLNAYRDYIASTGLKPNDQSEWSYPPSALLVAAPLSIAPLFASYLIWTIGGAALLLCALRFAALPRVVVVAAILSHAMFMNVVFGQNGALSAALLCSGLLLLEEKPILAGVLFGLLTFKPHLGLMVPICLLASRQWRAGGMAGLVALSTVALSGICFGWSSWRLFFEQTAPLMRDILERNYPQSYQINSVSLFVFLRSLGADLTTAWIGQTTAALLAAVFVWRAWRIESANHWSRVALAIMATFVATPYAYMYDLVSYSVALALLAFMLAHDGRLSLASKEMSLLLIAALWLWPELQEAAISRVYYQISAVAPILGFAVASVYWLKSNNAARQVGLSFEGELAAPASSQ